MKGVDHKKFAKRLWGDTYYNKKKRNSKANNLSQKTKKMINKKAKIMNIDKIPSYV